MLLISFINHVYKIIALSQNKFISYLKRKLKYRGVNFQKEIISFLYGKNIVHSILNLQ
jgi:hypothetical protein